MDQCQRTITQLYSDPQLEELKYLLNSTNQDDDSTGERDGVDMLQDPVPDMTLVGCRLHL